jgi:subtilisin family serine protease
MAKTILLAVGLLFTQALKAQTSGTAKISGNWFEKDPLSDSVAGISLDKAYELLKGRKSKTVIVAVIDNGVDVDHQDLKDNIYTNPKEIPDNGIDDDGNGYVDDVHGWNFRGTANGTVVENEIASSLQFYQKWNIRYDRMDSGALTKGDKANWIIYQRARKEYLQKVNSQDSTDRMFAFNIRYHSSSMIDGDSDSLLKGKYGSPRVILTKNLAHGTHVAGIIGAIRNNGIGIDGISDNVRIMPVIATTAVGDERDKDVANAIRYAVDNGAKIINMSFSKLFSPDKALVDEAVRYAEKKNVLIVHAAGNDGVDIDQPVNYHYPIAIYTNGRRAGNFITVGWSRPLFDYRLAHPYSDYGKRNVDIFAPGSDIYSTVPNNGYDYKSGSSMAAPVVSGVAAILLSYFPQLSAKQVRMILIRSAFRPDQVVNKPQTKTQVPFDTLSVSGGIVNAYNAVKMAMKMTKGRKMR